MMENIVIVICEEAIALANKCDEKPKAVAFVPGVIRNLYQISSKLDYALVLASEHPNELFLEVLSGESIRFDKVIGSSSEYIKAESEKEIILINGDLSVTKAGECVLKANSWNEIYEYLVFGERVAEIKRKTSETDILVNLSLEGKGRSEISTGLKFFDHMLEQVSKHSGSDLVIQVQGDLEVDEHHTIEDVAIVLGEAFKKVLGDKRGIERYGYCLPMDDCLALLAIDFGGRNWLEWNVEFKREKIGDMPTEMFSHFFKSFSDAAKCNLYIKAEGVNEHHKIEGIFKAFAKAIKMAVKQDPFNYSLPSTKGVL